jgi:hypothetical protein
MPDLTFETLLSGQLREYAEAGVRPIDGFVIAEETIASGRTMPRWRRGWGLAPTPANRILIPLLVGLLLAALVGGALLVGARLLLPMRHTYLNELVSAPDVSMPMAHPALVPLLDGRVLVIGDDGAGGGTGTRALVYDPATGGSEPTGPLVSSDLLGIDSAVRLKDGKVLVIGEVSAQVTNTFAQVFDPRTLRFTPAGPMIIPRLWPAVAVLPDGHVLIAGGHPSGQEAATSSAELFDPDALTFSPTGSMGTSRSMPSTAILPDGRVFISPGESRTTVEVYDPSTGTFSAAGTMSGYGYGDAIALPDGRVVVLGGSSLGSHGFAEVWDPASLTFSPRRDLPGWVRSATLLDDGRILLAGERRIGERTASWSGIYDPTTGATLMTQTPRAWGPRATRLADGRVLLVGGLTDGMTNHGEGGRSAPAVPTVEIFQ